MPGQSSLDAPAPKAARSTRRGAAPVKKAAPGRASAGEAMPSAMLASISAQPMVEDAEAPTAVPSLEIATVAGCNTPLLVAPPTEMDIAASSVAMEEELKEAPQADRPEASAAAPSVDSAGGGARPLDSGPLQTAQAPPLLPGNQEDSGNDEGASLGEIPSPAAPPVAAVKKRRTVGLRGPRPKERTFKLSTAASLSRSQHPKRKPACAAGSAALPKRPRTQVRSFLRVWSVDA